MFKLKGRGGGGYYVLINYDLMNFYYIISI